MTRFWLGVVHKSHVLRGVELGIVQANHGARGPVERMVPGDGFVYYSPKLSFPDGPPLQAFTAIGTVADGDAWEADDPDLPGRHPWRRAAHYATGVHDAPITPLKEVLELTRGNRNWGFTMRRGHLEMSEHDFRVIAEAMGAGTLVR